MKRFLVVFFLLISVLNSGQTGKGKAVFFKPNFNWAIETPFKDFIIVETKLLESDVFKVEAFNAKENIIFDIYIEKGSPDLEAVKIRDYYENILKQMETKMESVEKWENEQGAFLLYTSKNVVEGNPPKDELNGDFYRSKGYTWIDVRFRIQGPTPQDKEKIKKLLKEVRLIEAFEPTVEENVFMGGLYCLGRVNDFCHQCLGSAYEKEIKMPTLKKELRIALIENYSNFLRLNGDYQKALEVLNYGLTKDPNYPMYFWVKARIMADLGDEGATLSMLQMAVKNRKNLLKGEKLPDPRRDDAFNLLALKESFRVKITEIFKPLIEAKEYPEK